LINWDKVKHVSELNTDNKKQPTPSKSSINWDRVKHISEIEEKKKYAPPTLTTEKRQQLNDWFGIKQPEPKTAFDNVTPQAQSIVDRNLINPLRINKPVQSRIGAADIPAPISFATGLADTATMGLLSATANRNKTPKGLPELDANNPNKNPVGSFMTEAQADNPHTYMAGQAAGYFIPGAAIDKGVGTALKGATKALPGLAQRAIIGGASGAAQEFGEGVIRNIGDGDITKRDFANIGKRTAIGGAVGAGADVLLSGVANKLSKNKDNAKPLKDILSVQNSKDTITPSTLQNTTTTANKSVAEDIGLKQNNLTIKPKKGFADNVITINKPQKPKLPNERGFSANVRTDTAMNKDIRESFDENPLFKETLANKETLAKAESKFTGDFAKDYSDWNKNINNFDPSDVPLARKLANEAAKNGDIDTARRIIADVSEKLTQSGQYSQAASILRKADPATFNTFIERQFTKLNQQGREMYGKKWTDLSLTDDEMKQLYSKDVLSEDDREKVMEGIYDRISQSMPSSKMEKFDAWRRTAMLLNPKTHIRNVVGNGIMGVLRKSADTVGAGLEKVFLNSGERTKSFGWSLDNELKNMVDNVWQQEAKNLSGSNRYDINNLKFMNRDKRIFKNNAMNAIDNFTKSTLNVEDKVFLERAYKDALGGYMKSNGIKEVNQAAKDYAQRRAYEATFKQANFISDTINKLKNKKGIGKLVEGAIPFTQTPANIMMRGIEYSPAGIIKGLYGAANKQTGAQIIEDLSKGLTGTAALGAGYILASMGAAKWERSKSNTAAGLESEVGEQSGSIMTPWGSYTFDWAQPAAIPLAMGISFYEGLQKKNASKAEALTNAIASGGDTIINMTMLKNIKDLFGNGGSTTQKLMGIPVSYVEQAIPSIFGQIAKSTDTVKRSTYDPNPAKQELNKTISKIPWLSKTLPADYDIFGKEQDTGGAIQQFISPGYWKGNSKEPVTNELVRLYKANKETDFLPRVLTGSFSQNGTEYRLESNELADMKKKLGGTTLERMNFVMNTPNYKTASDDAKMAMLRTTVNRVYDMYKNNYVRSTK
jgi:hypothetical protein